LSVLCEIYAGAEKTVEHQSWSFVSSRIDVFRDISTLKLPTYYISMKNDCTSLAGARTNLTMCNKALIVSRASLSNLTCTENNRAKALRVLNSACTS
jgi:hypothetical protein